eukprot:304154_1
MSTYARVQQFNSEAHTLDNNDLQKTYETNIETGLSSTHAQNLSYRYGYNNLYITPPYWIILLRSMYGGFLNIILWFIDITLFILYAIPLQPNNATDLYMGITLAIIIAILSIFEFYFIELPNLELQKMAIVSDVTVIRDSKESIICSTMLVPGDIIQLNCGMKIPCDIRVIECTSDMEIDGGIITGNNEPFKIVSDVCAHDIAFEKANNICLGGTIVISGKGKGVVVATGMENYIIRSGIYGKEEETKMKNKPQTCCDMTLKCIRIIVILVVVIVRIVVFLV